MLELKVPFGSSHIIFAHSTWLLTENGNLIQKIPMQESKEPTFKEGDNLMIGEQKFHVISRDIAFQVIGQDRYFFAKYCLCEGEWKPPEWIKIGEVKKDSDYRGNAQ